MITKKQRLHVTLDITLSHIDMIVSKLITFIVLPLSTTIAHSRPNKRFLFDRKNKEEGISLLYKTKRENGFVIFPLASSKQSRFKRPQSHTATMNCTMNQRPDKMVK